MLIQKGIPLSDETIAVDEIVDEAPTHAVVQWRFMGNRPTDEKLRHAGDRDQLPVAVADRLIAAGLVVLLPPDAAVYDTPIGEPSRIVGYNTDIDVYKVAQALIDQTEQVTGTPGSLQKGRSARK